MQMCLWIWRSKIAAINETESAMTRMWLHIIFAGNYNTGGNYRERKQNCGIGLINAVVQIEDSDFTARKNRYQPQTSLTQSSTCVPSKQL